jgi:arabinofuranosyltransferase
MTRGLRSSRLNVFLLLWIPHALLVYRFWFLADDAFISFRFARNLALGHGLRYNLGEHLPVEGYSNFLWVIICSVFELFRLDITFWPSLLSAACGTVVLWLVFDTLRRRLEISLPVTCLATLSLGCFPPFAVWCTGGLATMPFALLMFVTFERLVLRRDTPAGLAAGIAGLLLALLRVEGIAWCVVILVLAIISRRLAGQRRLRPFIGFVLIVAIGYGLYYAWRYSYYQMPLANTTYAKAVLDGPRLMRGVSYVVSYVLTLVTPLLILPGSIVALKKRRRAIGLPIAAMAWAFPAYSILVTGDFMAMGRFLVPGLAFNTILLAWMLDDVWKKGRGARVAGAVVTAGLIAIALLPGWNRQLVPRSLLASFHFRFTRAPVQTEYERWEEHINNTKRWTARGKALKSYVAQRRPPGEYASFVAGAIGVTGYYSDLYIFDKHGLVTPEVGRRKLGPDEDPWRPAGHDKWVPTEYFLKDSPTIINAKVLRQADPQAVADELSTWAEKPWNHREHPELRNQYAPDFARVPSTDVAGTPEYVLTWTRIDANVPPADAWRDFAQRLESLRTTGHLPPP